MYDPNDVPDNISGARDDARMEMKPRPTDVPQPTKVNTKVTTTGR